MYEYIHFVLPPLIDNETITTIDLSNVTSPDKYSPTNPNCIVYYPSTKSSNPTKGNTTVDGNIELLNLTDGYDFNPAGQLYANEVSYEREVFRDGGYETICLPFTPSVIKDTEDNDITSHFSFEEYYGQESNNTVKFKTIDISGLQAGKAYIMKYVIPYNDSKQTINFIGYDQYIQNAPIEDTFAGYFCSMDKGEKKLFTLNNSGQSFCLFTSDLTKQFRAYISTESTTTCKLFNIEYDNTTAVGMMEDGNELEVYDIDGKLILKGKNIDDIRKTLKHGTYIINHKKYIFR